MGDFCKCPGISTARRRFNKLLVLCTVGVLLLFHIRFQWWIGVQLKAFKLASCQPLAIYAVIIIIMLPIKP
jgi:hypothetical protein